MSSSEMSFWDHLDVLRGYIIRVLVVLVVVLVGCFFALPYVFDDFILGPTHSDFFVYRWLGGALGEAYKSVQSSITLLKSGLGIFVIIAIAVTFLPTVLQGLGWSFCIFIGKAVAEALGIDGCAKLLEAIGTVFSTMIAVLLCVMSVFIIATAAAFTIGGEGS